MILTLSRISLSIWGRIRMWHIGAEVVFDRGEGGPALFQEDRFVEPHLIRRDPGEKGLLFLD